MGEGSETLTAEQGSSLLGAAREAVGAAARGRSPAQGWAELDPALTRDGAAFVTLRSPNGSLRGCIGELEPRRPLIDSVRGCAHGAARRDPRFTPVAPGEVDELRIAISVLTPARAVSGLEDVVVGRHGVLVERGFDRGVLLPEVAAEQGWDAETFLAHTCRKAGLPPDAWRDPATRISVFETIKLTE